MEKNVIIGNVRESGPQAIDAIATPFKDSEEAWFWYCRYEERSVFRSGKGARDVLRPCQLDDIYICVARLFIDKKIGRRHIKTLVKYGNLLVPPDPRIEAEAMDALWWDDALDKLHTILAKKGVVERAKRDFMRAANDG